LLRIAGGDVRAVRRSDGDSVIWRRATGSARITAYAQTDIGQLPASGAIVRLTGSGYGAATDIIGHIRFEQMVPGTYLFEATTPLHDAIEAVPERLELVVRPGEVAEGRVAVKPIARAAAEVCDVRSLDRDAAVLTGHVTHDSSFAERVRVTVEWPGGSGTAESREDGYYRICQVPTGKLLLVHASRDTLMSTLGITLRPGEVVRQMDLKLQP
jgi:hypothetical protein